MHTLVENTASVVDRLGLSALAAMLISVLQYKTTVKPIQG